LLNQTSPQPRQSEVEMLPWALNVKP